MKTFFLIICTLFLIILYGCDNKGKSSEELILNDSILLTIHNTVDVQRSDESVFLEIDELKVNYESFNENAFVLIDGEKEIPSQAIDQDNDGIHDGIVFNIDIAPNETKEIKQNPKKKNKC